MSGVLYAATLATALGCGLVAGVFFAFSSFVMASLKRLPSAQGITAMQSIIIVAVTPAFMTALFGTAAACLGLAGWALISMGGAPLALVLIGCALYLVGAIGVTIAFNVPLNNRLEKLHSRDAARPASGTSTSRDGPPGTTCAPSPLWLPRPCSPSHSMLRGAGQSGSIETAMKMVECTARSMGSRVNA